MNEYEQAIDLANRILDTPAHDPDSMESMLSRQLLRAIEREKELKAPGTCGKHPFACWTMPTGGEPYCTVCAETAKLQAKLDDLEDIDKVCDSANEQIGLLQTDLDKAQAEIAELKNPGADRPDKVDEITLLKREIAELKVEIGKLCVQRANWKDSAKALQAEIAELNIQHERILNQNVREIAELKALIEVAELQRDAALAEPPNTAQWMARSEHASEIAELRAGAAAVLEKAAAHFTSDAWIDGGNGTSPMEIADAIRALIPADYAAALAEKVADAVRSRDYEWFKALGCDGEPKEATLERIVADEKRKAEKATWEHVFGGLDRSEACGCDNHKRLRWFFKDGPLRAEAGK
jgi:hypothetical protein